MNSDVEVRKPRVKLVKIGNAFRRGEEGAAWLQFFGDSKGRVYIRIRRRGLRESWRFCMQIMERIPKADLNLKGKGPDAR